jgi:hypothetical protein
MGIMPNDRNQRLESALRRFGIPGTTPNSDHKPGEPIMDPGDDLPPTGSTPDPRRRIPVKKTRRN